MESTLFDTLLSNESMFTANDNNSAAKDIALDAADDTFLNRMESSVTPVNQADTTKHGDAIVDSQNINDNYTLNKDSNAIASAANATTTATANRPSSNRAESYSSSTTKLNTANNSYLDLQNLNIGGNIMESISTPSMMNDLMALLDEEAEGSSNMVDLHMVSPKAKENTSTNNINNYTGTNEPDSFVQPADLHTNSLMASGKPFQRKNSYVEDPVSFNNNITYGGRRASELVTTGTNGNSMFAGSNSRLSISDSLDFWDMTNNNTGSSTKFIDEGISQALNDYNMNFTGTANQRRNSTKLNHNITNIQENPFDESIDSNILSSPRQNNRHSIATNILQNFSFQPIMKPTTNNNNNNNNNHTKIENSNSLSMSPDTRSNDLFYSLYNQTEPNNLDLYNLSMSSEDISTTNNNNSGNMIPLQPDELLSSPRKKFIKPSMMLSESASLSAKLAITGLQKKPETFPTIDTQAYHHPTKIVKRKSISSSSIPANSRSENRRRRKSTIGITNATSGSNTITPLNNNSTGNTGNGKLTSSSHTTSPRTSTSASTSKRNSIANLNAALLEDPSIKPFQCKDCEKAFRRSEHLKRHVRSVHSTDRPFPCMLCEKKFSRSDNLSQHLKTHKKHGDF